jgi:octaprenyl-diphosphate synthase
MRWSASPVITKKRLSSPLALDALKRISDFMGLQLDSTAQALRLVQADMTALDGVIAARLDTGVPLVKEVSQYIISAGGKRLRPALLLLLCGALGYADARRYQLAAIIEFIHTATLLHDDVVDESTLRRGRSTANEHFGNPASVLVGDFLYSRAFQMMADLGDMRIMHILAEATNVIAEGEVLQLMNVHDASLTEADYLRVIRSKTAKLFEASARLAAVLAGADAATVEACATYGQALGTAFQVIDDVLDYDGDVDKMGKNLGDDLREGKVTLPLIIAMQRGTAEQAAVLRAAIEKGESDSEALQHIATIVRDTGALQATRQAAQAEAERASAALATFAINDYSRALLRLSGNLLTRTA